MVQVRCLQCQEERDSTFDFYWSGDRRHPYCKECQKRYSKNWADRHRKKTYATTSEEKKPHD